MNNRQNKLVINVKNVKIGGNNNIVLQSMTNTNTNDVNLTLKQIHELYEAGCELVRVSIPSINYMKSFRDICKSSPIPVIADIHFDYKLAILAVENGASKIRINPGNINNELHIKEICNICNNYGVPIRLGINFGSIQKNILVKYQNSKNKIAYAMVESTLNNIEIFNKFNFYNICLSLKSSNVLNTILAYKLISNKTNYPLHIGITESGINTSGIVKSSVGLGILLYLGIGNTIRVSLTNDPKDEIVVAKNILQTLNINKFFPEIISCPTCSRCTVNLIKLTNSVEKLCSNLKNINIKIAVMGCIVNGIGESKEADIGITCHNGFGFLFRKGKIIKKVSKNDLLKTLKIEIQRICDEKNV